MTMNHSTSADSQAKSWAFGDSFGPSIAQRFSANRPLDSWIDNRPMMLIMAPSKASGVRPALDLRVYEHLGELNAGFEQMRRALRGLEQHRAFRAAELARLGAWLEEARAATASYLAGAIEEAETKEAGRLFRARLALERKED